MNSNADVLQQKVDDLESRTQRTAHANEIKLNDNLAQIEARIEEHAELMQQTNERLNGIDVLLADVQEGQARNEAAFGAQRP